MDKIIPLDQSFTITLDEEYELKRVSSLTPLTLDSEIQHQNETEEIVVSTNLGNLQTMLDNVIGNYLQDLAHKPMKLSFSFDKMPMMDSQKLGCEKDKSLCEKSDLLDEIDESSMVKASVLKKQNNFVEQLTSQVITQLKGMQQNNQLSNSRLETATPMSKSRENLDKFYRLFEEMQSLNPEEQVKFLMRIINEQQEQIKYWRKKALGNGMSFENFSMDFDHNKQQQSL